MKSLLAEILEKEKRKISLIPSSSQATADIVTGAPGSGKSFMSARILHDRQDAVYICGDAIKKIFKDLARTDPVLYQDPNMQNDGYIHKMTSSVSWLLLDYCIENKKNFILEMIGTGAKSDAALVNRLMQEGYSTSLNHVATPRKEMVKNMIVRYFGDSQDSGRYVSLLRAIKMRGIAVKSFEDTIRLLGGNKQVPISLFNNRHAKMVLVFNEQPSSACADKINQFFAEPMSGHTFKPINAFRPLKNAVTSWDEIHHTRHELNEKHHAKA